MSFQDVDSRIHRINAPESLGYQQQQQPSATAVRMSHGNAAVVNQKNHHQHGNASPLFVLHGKVVDRTVLPVLHVPISPTRVTTSSQLRRHAQPSNPHGKLPRHHALLEDDREELKEDHDPYFHNHHHAVVGGFEDDGLSTASSITFDALVPPTTTTRNDAAATHRSHHSLHRPMAREQQDLDMMAPSSWSTSSRPSSQYSYRNRPSNPTKSIGREAVTTRTTIELPPPHDNVAQPSPQPSNRHFVYQPSSESSSSRYNHHPNHTSHAHQRYEALRSEIHQFQNMVLELERLLSPTTTTTASPETAWRARILWRSADEANIELNQALQEAASYDSSSMLDLYLPLVREHRRIQRKFFTVTMDFTTDHGRPYQHRPKSAPTTPTMRSSPVVNHSNRENKNNWNLANSHWCRPSSTPSEQPLHIDDSSPPYISPNRLAAVHELQEEGEEDFFVKAMREREQDMTHIHQSLCQVNNIYQELARLADFRQQQQLENHVRYSQVLGSDPHYHPSNTSMMTLMTSRSSDGGPSSPPPPVSCVPLMMMNGFSTLSSSPTKVLPQLSCTNDVTATTLSSISPIPGMSSMCHGSNNGRNSMTSPLGSIREEESSHNHDEEAVDSLVPKNNIRELIDVRDGQDHRRSGGRDYLPSDYPGDSNNTDNHNNGEDGSSPLVLSSSIGTEHHHESESVKSTFSETLPSLTTTLEEEDEEEDDVTKTTITQSLSTAKSRSTSPETAVVEEDFQSGKYRPRRQTGTQRRRPHYSRRGGGVRRRQRGRYESDDDEDEYDAIETPLMLCNSGIPDISISSAATRCLNGHLSTDGDRVDNDDDIRQRGAVDEDDGFVSVTPSMLAERDFRWTMPLETFPQGMKEVHDDIVGLGRDTYRLVKKYYHARDGNATEAEWFCGKVVK